MAHSLSRKGDTIKKFSEGMLPYLILLGLLAAVVIVQPDLGMIIVFCMVTMAMLFFAGARIIHLLSVGAAGIPLAFLAIRLAPYRFARPAVVPQSAGLQPIDRVSNHSIAHGHRIGRNLGARTRRVACEAVLPAAIAQRFHHVRSCRRTRFHRSAGHCDPDWVAGMEGLQNRRDGA